MLAVLLGFGLFVLVCFLALYLGMTAQQQVRLSLHQSLHDHSKYVRFMQDKHDLNRLGYAQQLTRRLNGFSVFAVPFSGMSVMTGAALLLLPALAQGGPWLLSFGWPILGLFTLLVACSHAAQSSAYPTAGGIYHSTVAAGGRRTGITAGWLQFLGTLFLLAGSNLLLAYWLTSTIAVMGSFELERWHFLGLLAGLYASQYLYSVRAASSLGRYLTGTAWMQVAAIVLTLVLLSISRWGGYLPLTEMFRWHHPFDVSGGSSSLASALTGLLLLARPLMGAEHTATLAEETVDPRIQIPWAIFLSTVYVFIFGYILFAILFIHYPLVPDQHVTWQLLLDDIASRWELWGDWLSPLCMVIVLWSGWSSGLVAMTAASRLWLAMSRDETVPLARLGTKVSRRWRVPHVALFGAAGLSMLAAFLLLAIHDNGETELAICVQLLALGMLGLHGAAWISVGARRIASIRHKTLAAGPWQLGVWGPIVEYAALGFLLLMIGGAAWLLTASSWLVVGVALITIWLATVRRIRHSRRKEFVKATGANRFSRRQLEELIQIERNYTEL
ncbi:amino acid transporter [Paenibacillus phyllosphaerae]|uniref:Amino acid transporter n=1 Tax=Paenibacillus phyllosphaerae TaxID=274593 RepID=A0A7W5AX17_9BACL|nr:APC family permease [Paenibacillus phyllosphaerae]MBB3110318.1 amino acid transporter [Paenibacillus phyllosphaerae]